MTRILVVGHMNTRNHTVRGASCLTTMADVAMDPEGNIIAMREDALTPGIYTLTHHPFTGDINDNGAVSMFLAGLGR